MPPENTTAGSRQSEATSPTVPAPTQPARCAIVPILKFSFGVSSQDITSVPKPPQPCTPVPVSNPNHEVFTITPLFLQCKDRGNARSTAECITAVAVDNCPEKPWQLTASAPSTSAPSTSAPRN